MKYLRPNAEPIWPRGEVESSLLGSGEGLAKCLSHWGLEYLVLQEVSINRMGRPGAVLLDMVKWNSGLKAERRPPSPMAMGGIMLL